MFHETSSPFNIGLAFFAFYFCFRLLFYFQHETLFHFSRSSYNFFVYPTIFNSFHFSRSSYNFFIYPAILCSLCYDIFAPILVDNLCLSKIGSFPYQLSQIFVFNETNIFSYDMIMIFLCKWEVLTTTIS